MEKNDFEEAVVRPENHEKGAESSEAQIKKPYNPLIPMGDDADMQEEQADDDSQDQDTPVYAKTTEIAKNTLDSSETGQGAEMETKLDSHNNENPEVTASDDTRDQKDKKIDIPAASHHLMEEEPAANQFIDDVADHVHPEGQISEGNVPISGALGAVSNNHSNLSADHAPKNQDSSEGKQKSTLEVESEAHPSQSHTNLAQKNERVDNTSQSNHNKAILSNDQIRNNNIESQGTGFHSSASVDKTQANLSPQKTGTNPNNLPGPSNSKVGTSSRQESGAMAQSVPNQAHSTKAQEKSIIRQPEPQKQSSTPPMDPMLAMMHQMMKSREESGADGQGGQNREEGANAFMEICKIQSTLLEDMKKQIEFKDQQIEFKDKQIADLKKEHKKLQRSRSRSRSKTRY